MILLFISLKIKILTIKRMIKIYKPAKKYFTFLAGFVCFSEIQLKKSYIFVTLNKKQIKNGKVCFILVNGLIYERRFI